MLTVRTRAGRVDAARAGARPGRETGSHSVATGRAWAEVLTPLYLVDLVDKGGWMHPPGLTVLVIGVRRCGYWARVRVPASSQVNARLPRETVSEKPLDPLLTFLTSPAPPPQASSRSRGCRVDYLALGTESKDYLLRVRDLMLSTMWERLER